MCADPADSYNCSGAARRNQTSSDTILSHSKESHYYRASKESHRILGGQAAWLPCWRLLRSAMHATMYARSIGDHHSSTQHQARRRGRRAALQQDRARRARDASAVAPSPAEALAGCTPPSQAGVGATPSRRAATHRLFSALRARTGVVATPRAGTGAP